MCPLFYRGFFFRTAKRVLLLVFVVPHLVARLRYQLVDARAVLLVDVPEELLVYRRELVVVAQLSQKGNVAHVLASSRLRQLAKEGVVSVLVFFPHHFKRFDAALPLSIAKKATTLNALQGG